MGSPTALSRSSRPSTPPPPPPPLPLLPPTIPSRRSHWALPTSVLRIYCSSVQTLQRTILSGHQAPPRSPKTTLLPLVHPRSCFWIQPASWSCCSIQAQQVGIQAIAVCRLQFPGPVQLLRTPCSTGHISWMALCPDGRIPAPRFWPTLMCLRPPDLTSAGRRKLREGVRITLLEIYRSLCIVPRI
ncbi:hypothetical protein BS78_06G044500 [Paspalum vaginatum]|nr:hypothetical protein BS78_06G044500 [Paspalum vaginatum]